MSQQLWFVWVLDAAEGNIASLPQRFDMFRCQANSPQAGLPRKSAVAPSETILPHSKGRPWQFKETMNNTKNIQEQEGSSRCLSWKMGYLSVCAPISKWLLARWPFVGVTMPHAWQWYLSSLCPPSWCHWVKSQFTPLLLIVKCFTAMSPT